jgi:hypothetical protein
MPRIYLSAGPLLIFLMIACCHSVNPAPSSTPGSASSAAVSPDISPSPVNNQSENIGYIKTGTYFGHCVGYCQESFTITSGKISYQAKTNGNSGEPEISSDDTFAAADYNNLLKTISLKNFTALADRIGCPDCADGGGEWIEIKYGNSVKKIDFEYNAEIPEIKDFLEKLRIIRNEHKNPYFINRIIAGFLNQEPKNPPLKIYQYDYNGKKVYFISSYCCDIQSQLYNEDGTLLCAPDGGITGKGDGKCSDFFTARKNERLVWQDTRK